jgi:excisionase family DNA binding protein
MSLMTNSSSSPSQPPNASPKSPEIPRKLLSVREFTRWAGVGMTTTYGLMKAGALKSVKIGNLTRIKIEEAERWAASLPERAA